MKPFAHYNARSIREAAKLLKAYEGKAKVNAGGTDLLGALRNKSIARLSRGSDQHKDYRGPRLYQEGQEGHPHRRPHKARRHCRDQRRCKEEYGLLAEAVHSVASPHVRNMATLGGNLAQEVRCWYYRYPHQIGGPIVCLRKGGKICSALAGDNRYHSLFGAAPLTPVSLLEPLPGPDRHPRLSDKVRKGEFAEAARILMEYNPSRP